MKEYEFISSVIFMHQYLGPRIKYPSTEMRKSVNNERATPDINSILGIDAVLSFEINCPGNKYTEFKKVKWYDTETLIIYPL